MTHTILDKCNERQDALLQSVVERPRVHEERRSAFESSKKKVDLVVDIQYIIINMNDIERYINFIKIYLEINFKGIQLCPCFLPILTYLTPIIYCTDYPGHCRMKLLKTYLNSA